MFLFDPVSPMHYYQPRAQPALYRAPGAASLFPPARKYYDEDEDDSSEEEPQTFSHRGPSPYSLKELQRRRQAELQRQRQLEEERQRRLTEQRLQELRYREELARREQEMRQKELARREQLRQQQLRQARARKELELEQLRLRKASLLRFHLAARKIQRAFREHLARARLERAQAAAVIQRAYRRHLEERREEAASTLQRAVRRYLATKEARDVLAKLRELRGLEQHVEELRGAHLAKGEAATLRECLGYEEALTKAMLKLDAVLSGGSEEVRACRKRLIAKTQGYLDEFDRQRRLAGQPATAAAPMEVDPAEMDTSS